MKKASNDESKRNSAAGGVAEEILSRIRTVMAFNGQRQGMKRYLVTSVKDLLVMYLSVCIATDVQGVFNYFPNAFLE